MRHKIILLCLQLVISLACTAQGPARCEFSGSIQRESNQQPIAMAQLFLSNYPPARGSMDTNWSSSMTDANGVFRIDVKESPRFMRIITSNKDTIDIEVNDIQCNTSRDIQVNVSEASLTGNSFQSTHRGIELPEVVLQAYGTRQSIEQMPASVGLVTKQLLEATDQTSLQNALNTIPGVIMESRGYGGSHRLSIRGSSLRSPFAVRNIKMYLDGIPLTAADGQTPLELPDAADIESIEVIKGPAGSLYGSGNGGVLLLKSVPVTPGTLQIQTTNQLASFDGYRSNTSVAVGFKKSDLRISHVWQEYAGYRQQEFNRKQQVSIRFKQQLSDHQTLTLWGSYYYGNWGLPGALNRLQADTLPTQAVPFSILNNASLARERYVGAISQEGSWREHFRHSVNINVHQANKENPYGTSAFNSGYKIEHTQSLTGRALIEYNNSFNAFRVQGTLGTEWQTEHYSILEQTIASAQPNEFKYFYDIGYQQNMVFGQGIVEWKDIICFQSGLSRSSNEQFVRGKNASDFQFDTTTTRGNFLLPRWSVNLKLADGLHLYRSYSAGADNPTVFEMIDQENNAYNLQLTSERGRLNELGVKHQLKKRNLRYSLALYQFDIDNAILPFNVINSAGESVQRYQNNGSTRQQGLEWSIQWSTSLPFKAGELSVWNNGSSNNHRFNKYTENDLILNGNRMPGVPLNQVTSGIQIKTKQFNITIIDYWMDRIALNNENTMWTNPYNLMNISCGYQYAISNYFESGIQAGVNNILNVHYSSFLNLNGSLGKYYNPSAPRNWFIGIRLSYRMHCR
jgi:iron complex outermembrane recepter protein